MNRGIALSFALLLAFFEIGSCLRCQQCNSQNDLTCADPYSGKRHSVDCQTQDAINYNRQYLRAFLPNPDNNFLGNPPPKYCHKIVTVTGTVIRACLDSHSAQANYTCQTMDNAGKLDPNKSIKHCSYCSTDDCNGASAISSSLPLGLVLLASYLYFK